MAFTYDLATDRGKCRFLTRDTNGQSYDFDDTEVDFALTQESGLGLKGAAALLYEVLAGDRAKLAVRKGRLGVEDDLTKMASELRAQAKLWRDQAEAESSGGVLVYVLSPSWTRADYERNILMGDSTVTDETQKKAYP